MSVEFQPKRIKAFDSIRHNQLFAKLSALSIPDEIYNWITHFFTDRGHCTKFGSDLSVIAEISILKHMNRLRLGPALYVVTAGDMQPDHDGNVIIKYADDTYLIVPAVNSDTIAL